MFYGTSREIEGEREGEREQRLTSVERRGDSSLSYEAGEPKEAEGGQWHCERPHEPHPSATVPSTAIPAIVDDRPSPFGMLNRAAALNHSFLRLLCDFHKGTDIRKHAFDYGRWFGSMI